MRAQEHGREHPRPVTMPIAHRGVGETIPGHRLPKLAIGATSPPIIRRSFAVRSPLQPPLAQVALCDEFFSSKRGSWGVVGAATSWEARAAVGVCICNCEELGSGANEGDFGRFAWSQLFRQCLQGISGSTPRIWGVVPVRSMVPSRKLVFAGDLSGRVLAWTGIGGCALIAFRASSTTKPRARLFVTRTRFATPPPSDRPLARRGLEAAHRPTNPPIALLAALWRASGGGFDPTDRPIAAATAEALALALASNGPTNPEHHPPK